LPFRIPCRRPMPTSGRPLCQSRGDSHNAWPRSVLSRIVSHATGRRLDGLYVSVLQISLSHGCFGNRYTRFPFSKAIDGTI
jgi:hypothetical protein